MAIFRYKLFVPLHELWLQYIDQLYGTSGPNAFSQKLLKADFHGATLTGFKYIYNIFLFFIYLLHLSLYLIFMSHLIIIYIYITVSKSKCFSYIGVTGIVVQETENMFKLITKNDSLKCKLMQKNKIYLFVNL